MPRIGYLGAGPGLPSPLVDAFRQGLGEHGYIEGQNVRVEYRFAGFRPERYRRLVDELIHLPVDLIVTADSEATPVARLATSTIPIIMSVSGDPVGEGLVTSLARPGGNVTGLTNLASALSGQRLELLQQAVPGLRRVAVLWNSNHSGVQLAWRETRCAAASLDLELLSLGVTAPEDLERAFETANREQVEAILVLTDRLTTYHRKRIVSLAAAGQLPGMYGWRDFTEAGGLMACGPNRFGLYRRAGYYVSQILQGIAPSELPVEHSPVEVTVNLTAAGALGLAVSPHLLRQATAVIR